MTTTLPRAGRREYLGLAVLALPTILVALDLSVPYLAVPQLWITDIHGFLVAGPLLDSAFGAITSSLPAGAAICAGLVVLAGARTVFGPRGRR